jgi:hypothetical protein
MAIIVAIIPTKIRYDGFLSFSCEDPSPGPEGPKTTVKQNNM